jgi:hypothetical protein
VPVRPGARASGAFGGRNAGAGATLVVRRAKERDVSHSDHAKTHETSPGSVPGEDVNAATGAQAERGAAPQAPMSDAPDDDRSEVPPQGNVPDDLAEAGEQQLKEGMQPGGRVAGAGNRTGDDPMHDEQSSSGTPGATDRS